MLVDCSAEASQAPSTSSRARKIVSSLPVKYELTKRSDIPKQVSEQNRPISTVNIDMIYKYPLKHLD